jgi:hypothetical protein
LDPLPSVSATRASSWSVPSVAVNTQLVYQLFGCDCVMIAHD